MRVDDPGFAAALTGPPRRPQPAWAPIGLRVLALLLIAVGVLASAPMLVLAALVVSGIAPPSGLPGAPRSTTAGGEDLPPSSRAS